MNDLHRRLLTLDAHLDVPVHFGRAGWRFGDRHALADDVAQVDLPRMEDGNLTGGFFVTYTEQGALDAAGYATALAAAWRRSDQIDRMLAAYPDRIGLALTADDARRLHAEGRCVVFKSIENSYFMGDDPAGHLAEFHARGVRMAGPVHARTNQLADSSTDAAMWHGLSPAGRDWLRAANELGIVVDASHAADSVFDQLIAESAAPIALSHSGSRTVHDHPRNIDDGRLRALAAQGGVVCLATIFLSEMRMTADRARLFGLHGRIYDLDPAAQAALARDWIALDAAEPMWTATLDRFVEGLAHVIDVAGIDHVGIGADWDGGGGFPGMDDITVLPAVTDRLAARGLTEADLEKLWSGNLLRVVEAARAAGKEQA
ncbi:dipeptidase [Sphingomonas sp. Y38-1Y]|uniref:dipeptidase n=1 Tax=Sphingomonas sp. Y38-1Y TaxID=3078265 RepID=UPI0028EB82A9|nr:membrane dipeptidase [Sphingomonas sp. Y38-1Y]